MFFPRFYHSYVRHLQDYLHPGYYFHVAHKEVLKQLKNVISEVFEINDEFFYTTFRRYFLNHHQSFSWQKATYNSFIYYILIFNSFFHNFNYKLMFFKVSTTSTKDIFRIITSHKYFNKFLCKRRSCVYFQGAPNQLSTSLLRTTYRPLLLAHLQGLFWCKNKVIRVFHPKENVEANFAFDEKKF